jgi:hypothetical protein
LTEAGRVITACYTNLELITDENKQRCKDYDQRVKELLSSVNHVIPQGNNIVLQDWNDFPVEEGTGVYRRISARCLT